MSNEVLTKAAAKLRTFVHIPTLHRFSPTEKARTISETKEDKPKIASEVGFNPVATVKMGRKLVYVRGVNNSQPRYLRPVALNGQAILPVRGERVFEFPESLQAGIGSQVQAAARPLLEPQTAPIYLGVPAPSFKSQISPLADRSKLLSELTKTTQAARSLLSQRNQKQAVAQAASQALPVSAKTVAVNQPAPKPVVGSLPATKTPEPRLEETKNPTAGLGASAQPETKTPNPLPAAPPKEEGRELPQPNKQISLPPTLKAEPTPPSQKIKFEPKEVVVSEVRPLGPSTETKGSPLESLAKLPPLAEKLIELSKKPSELTKASYTPINIPAQKELLPEVAEQNPVSALASTSVEAVKEPAVKAPESPQPTKTALETEAVEKPSGENPQLVPPSPPKVVEEKQTEPKEVKLEASEEKTGQEVIKLPGNLEETSKNLDMSKMGPTQPPLVINNPVIISEKQAAQIAEPVKTPVDPKVLAHRADRQEIQKDTIVAEGKLAKLGREQLSEGERDKLSDTLKNLEHQADIMVQYEGLQYQGEKQRIAAEVHLLNEQIDKKIRESELKARNEGEAATERQKELVVQKAKIAEEVKALAEKERAKKARGRNVVAAQPAFGKMIPPKVSFPNVVNGIVRDKGGLLVSGAVMIIKDEKGEPVRALKSNKIGQFVISTPLPNGTYNIELEKDSLEFDITQVQLGGEIMKPIEIKAI
ncbi:MAG: hypothetical protein Q8P13_00455 [bacterium]|nr:hypothetical protein [bacterium]